MFRALKSAIKNVLPESFMHCYYMFKTDIRHRKYVKLQSGGGALVL